MKKQAKRLLVAAGIAAASVKLYFYFWRRKFGGSP